MAPSGGVSGLKRRLLSTVRPICVNGEDSLRQTVDVDVAVAIRHFPKLWKTLVAIYSREGSISFMEYPQRLQACIARLEGVFRVGIERPRASPRAREDSSGVLRQKVGYLRSTVEEIEYLRGRACELTDHLVEMAGLIAHARAGPSVGYPHARDSTGGKLHPPVVLDVMRIRLLDTRMGKKITMMIVPVVKV